MVLAQWVNPGWLLIGALTLGSLSCGTTTGTQAAVATAVTVVATGVNRKLTGDCWAACTPGHVCERESGLCIRGECSPSCGDHQFCVKLEGQLTCVDKAALYTADLQRQRVGIRLGGAAPAAPRTPAGQAGSAWLVEVNASTSCAEPGSDAWFAEGVEVPSGATGAERAEQPALAGAAPAKAEPAQAGVAAAGPPGRQADFVGIWSIEMPASRPPSAGPRPLIVTPDWYGHSKDRAVSYQVTQRTPERLVLTTSLALGSEQELSVQFVDADHFSLRGVKYRRLDCTAAQHPPACCELPRARWVRLKVGLPDVGTD